VSKDIPAKSLDLNVLLDHLRKVELFSDIREDETALKTIASILSERRFTKDENITEEGKTGTDMFILIDGQASVYKATPTGDEYKVAIFHADKRIAFGESGLIETDTRTATIRADVDCRCLVLGRTAFEDFSKRYPQWALPIYRKIAHSVMARLRKTNDDMLLLYNALVAEIRGA
jgi:CRP-like cAMP-binding protein